MSFNRKSKTKYNLYTLVVELLIVADFLSY
jgi:hypothetical protein